MSIAIMQPYFFPYIGYYSLVANTDRFVFFDTPQYIRRGWINRNRILSCKNEPIYVNIPIHKADRSTAIKDIVIDYELLWKEKMYGQLTVYKTKAPNYNDVMDLVHDVIETDTKSLSVIAQKSITETMRYLNISKEYDVFSEMEMQDITVSAPDEWALYITKALGYDTYINPIGGMTFFDSKKYEEQGIKLFFLQQELVPYRQFGQSFEPGLSMIDVMMFCSADEIIDMMKRYQLLTGEE